MGSENWVAGPNKWGAYKSSGLVCGMNGEGQATARYRANDFKFVAET
jgi:hypothetical protein